MKSGDFAALSKADIRLMALTHMLNAQFVKKSAESSATDAAHDSKESRPLINSSTASKTTTWSRALFANKLSSPSTASAATAAATETPDAAAEGAEEAKTDGLFGADDFPALGSVTVHYDGSDMEGTIESIASIFLCPVFCLCPSLYINL